MAGIIVLILLIVLLIVILIKGFVIISQGETMVIERLGKYSRTLNSGVNILLPFIEKPREILWRTSAMIQGENKITPTKKVSKIDLREQVYDYPKQNVITKDNVNIEIDALLYFQITDPMRAVYEVADLPNAIEKLTQTTLRNVIGELELDESLSSRDTINSKLTKILDEATDKWGVKVNRVELKDRLGVCLDTCHVWDGGYDIVNDLDGVLTEFDRVIGLERLKAVHINDSMNPRGSHKDRHAKIGEGTIGLEAFGRIVRHPALQDLPFILETPNDDAGWAAEIAMLRKMAEG